MRHISFETARTWIERLAGLPAPVRMEDIPGVAAEFGWKPTKWDDEYRYEEGGEAQVVLVGASGIFDKIHNVTFDLVRNWEEDLLGNVAVVDFFPRFVEASCGVWGEPWSVMTDVNTIHFIWKLHEQGYAEMILWSDCVACYFRTYDRTEERW